MVKTNEKENIRVQIIEKKTAPNIKKKKKGIFIRKTKTGIYRGIDSSRKICKQGKILIWKREAGRRALE